MGEQKHSRKDRLHVTETPDVSHIKNVDVLHETSDINISAVFKFVLFLTLMTIAVYVLMWALFRVLNSRAQKTDANPGPMAMSETERRPPEPRLQLAPGFAEELAKSAGPQSPGQFADPAWEIRVLRNLWNDSLTNGLRDQSGKVVGMPIDQAMTKVLEGQGLPARLNSGKAEDYVIEMPSAASSGRVNEKRLQ